MVACVCNLHRNSIITCRVYALFCDIIMQLEEVSSSGEEEETEHTPSPPPPPEMNLDFDIPSPKTYLAKLKASLEKSTRYTNSKSKHLKPRHHSSRKRHFTSPIPFKGSRVPSTNGQRLSESRGSGDDDLSSSDSSSSSISLTAVDIGRSKRATSKSPVHSHFSPASKGILGAGLVTAWDQPTVHRLTNAGATTLSTRLATLQNGTSSVSGDEKSDIMSSLQMINGQLGELLCRLGPQPLTSATPLALPYSRYSPSPVSSFAVGDIGAASVHQTSTLLNTSGK